jgi:hypothetical protein
MIFQLYNLIGTSSNVLCPHSTNIFMLWWAYVVRTVLEMVLTI